MKNNQIYCEFDENIEFICTADKVSDIASEMFEYIDNTTDYVKKISNLINFDNTVFSFDIFVTNNDVIRSLNSQYRKIDAPTDVLTFSMFVDSEEFRNTINDGNINLGQIVISLERIKEQAQENDVTFEFEFFNILAHGILHLLGIDHLDNESLDYMMNLQRKMIEGTCDVKV